MLPPRPVLAMAILLVGGLAWSVADAPPLVASLGEAARWEGQSVTLVGWAAEVRRDEAATRFALVDGAHRVAVRVADPDAEVLAGDRVQAAGRLARWQGDLRLDVEDRDAMRVLPGPAPGATATPAWHELAARPEDWTGRPLLLRGIVEGDVLRDGGYSVAVGDGTWPAAGAVQVLGFLRGDPACLCHRLDAREVRPWTP